MQKTIVVSAINFFEGGPLSILKDCLKELSGPVYQSYRIVVLVHNEALLADSNLSANMKVVAFPLSRKSYFYRLYYEYVYFQCFSEQEEVYLWFSLHDISPRIKAQIKAVYCHNPTPFYKASLSDWYRYPALALSAALYKYIYWINIHSNQYVLVQSLWMKNAFVRMFGLPPQTIMVAYPPPPAALEVIPLNAAEVPEEVFTFFYPSLPRSFKNMEVVCAASRQLTAEGYPHQLILTLSGTENTYSRWLYAEYGQDAGIRFAGRLTREEVFARYASCSVLLFPSRLETWGLPITEFKTFNKPLIVADLPYSKETLGTYKKVIFADPGKMAVWTAKMKQIMDGKAQWDGNTAIEVPDPTATNWTEIFNTLLKL